MWTTVAVFGFGTFVSLLKNIHVRVLVPLTLAEGHWFVLDSTAEAIRSHRVAKMTQETYPLRTVFVFFPRLWEASGGLLVQKPTAIQRSETEARTK